LLSQSNRFAINSLQFQLLTESLDSDQIKSESDIDIDLCYDENLVMSIISNYLNNPSRIINVYPKSNHWYSNILFNYDKIQFHRTLRMKQSMFWMIINKIKTHKIFKNISQNKQSPIEKQLAVVLYRLGGKATIWNICFKFRIAKITVSLFISRVIKALKDLKKDVIV
ncbi:15942_t:CDS:2, partial [Dentiscutata heterogama]